MHHAVYVDAYTRECTGMYVFAVTHARKHKYMSPCMCLLCLLPQYDNPLPHEIKESA